MRIIIVSNRLPTLIEWRGKKLQFRETAGDLVSTLMPWIARQPHSHLWVGWPGATVPPSQQPTVRALLQDEHVPVFLAQSTMDRFYKGFCNRTLWPLFHYFPSDVEYDADTWMQYRGVNEAFLAALEPVVQPDDVIWIHDYHLLLLPAMLRSRFPANKIGFFMQVPFPSYETFRLLPHSWRNELLEGMLGADLIGFNTYDYSDHFVKCVRRMLGHDSHLGNISVHGRQVRADTFPMGIDYDLYAGLVASDEVESERAKLQRRLSGVRAVVSVDWLDHSKGIAQRLRGYARFLELNPNWRGKVSLAMVVVPSRIGADQQHVMKREVDELVGAVNGRWGSVEWTPVHYQNRMLTQEQLTALYSVSDVALMTPLRDGMNLAAKQYVASRLDGRGVLILSEMAGASQDLGEALVINPNYPDETASALRLALEMPVDDQVARNQILQERTRKFDLHWWADDFLRNLQRGAAEGTTRVLTLLDDSLQTQAVAEFTRAAHRLILLDYDGTLVTFYPHPDQAAPSEEVLRIVARLSSDARTTVAIVSGRNRGTLEHWFSEMNVILSAEHGAWTREIGRHWSTRSAFRNDWKDQLRPHLQAFAARLAGAFVEEKDYALVWHYRNADPYLGRHRANELMDTLTAMVANMDVQVQPGHGIVEVRNASINKGTITKRLLKRADFDFILAAGDDWTDEALLQDLPPQAWSIKVKSSSAYARFSLLGPDGVVALLDRLAATIPTP